MAASLFNINTCFPGIIESIAGNKVQIKPAIKAVNPEDGSVEELPILVDIPLVFPRGANAGISWKVQKGDGVLVVFSKFNIDQWLQGNGDAPEQDDNRQFQLSDAIAIPGLFPFSNTPPATEGLKITSDELSIELVDGKIKAGEGIFKKLINEEFQSMFNTHTHPYVGLAEAATGLTLYPASDPTGATPINITSNEMTSILEAE